MGWTIRRRTARGDPVADGRGRVYDHAPRLANEAITEAVARYLHEAMLEKEERQEVSELT